MEKNNYVDFEVWKKLNKDKKINFNLKSSDDVIEEVKKELFCKSLKKDKKDDKD